MLLNISIFAWYGAVCPWPSFRVNNVIPIYRLIPLGIMILMFRRIPFVLGAHKFLHQIEGWQQALYTGFFGPIGVSAVFYLYIAIDFLSQVQVDGVVREDCERLIEVVTVVVWFLVMCSVVVHGMSVPFGKFSYHFPRTISMALSNDPSDIDEPDVPHPFSAIVRRVGEFRRRRGKVDDTLPTTNSNAENDTTKAVYEIGELRPARTAIKEQPEPQNNDSQSKLEPRRPVIIIDSPLPSPRRSPANSRTASPRNSRISQSKNASTSRDFADRNRINEE